MLRMLFLIGTTGFWIAMMSLLVHKEYFQIALVQAPYEVLPIHNLSLREEYHGVYLGKELIGFSRNVLEDTDEKEGIDFELRYNTYLSFRFLGESREMLLKGKAKLAPTLELKEFDLKISSGDYWTKMRGEVDLNHMILAIEGKEGEPMLKRVPIRRPLYFSESIYLLWTPENLSTGRRGQFLLWNPLLMSFEEISFRVGRKVLIPFEGKEAEVFVIYLLKDGIETRAWVTPEGVVLKQESPTGLLLIKEDAWKIFDTLREKRKNLPDLPNLYSVASNRILKNPLNLSLLKVSLKLGDEERILTRRLTDLSLFQDIPYPVTQVKETYRPFLDSTDWIQADDAAIVKQAKALTEKEHTALGAALKIMRWVHQNILPTPTVAIPSARQVFAIRKGDCNEYTALFTALARAAGIPTKMVAGLVYQQGRFYYHAWPEIYLGEWIGLDPTFNQAPVDVTHIPLVEGDLKKQVELIGQIGRIRIHILEAT